MEQVNAGRMPISLADLADGADRGYQEWVTIRLPVDAAKKVEERAKAQGISESEYMRKILVLQVMRKHR